MVFSIAGTRMHHQTQGVLLMIKMSFFISSKTVSQRKCLGLVKQSGLPQPRLPVNPYLFQSYHLLKTLYPFGLQFFIEGYSTRFGSNCLLMIENSQGELRTASMR